ncbi:MAG: HAD family hydrolase [Dehalococcoidales bacterium]|jgi:putative hydrolase of the HAD superfamily
MIKAVFFDLYQTLVHYKPSQEELEAGALKESGFDVSAAALRRPILAANQYIYDEIAARPLSRRTREEAMTLYTEYQRVVLREAGIKADEKTVLKLLGLTQQAKMDLILFDDVLPALDALKKRQLTLGLISNIERDMTATLDRLGLAARLDIVVTSQDTGFTKPHREIFDFAIAKAGVPPAATVYIGDQYNVDVIGSRAAGMKALLLDRDDYYQEKLDCPRLRSLRELEKHLA